MTKPETNKYLENSPNYKYNNIANTSKTHHVQVYSKDGVDIAMMSFEDWSCDHHELPQLSIPENSGNFALHKFDQK